MIRFPRKSTSFSYRILEFVELYVCFDQLRQGGELMLTMLVYDLYLIVASAYNRGNSVVMIIYVCAMN